MILLLKIYWDKNLYDKVALYQKRQELKQIVTYLLQDFSSIKTQLSNHPPPIKRKCDFNAYFVCYFITVLKNSENYRLAVTKYLFNTFQLDTSSVLRIRIRLFNPQKHIIDYKWGNILNDLCHERRELDSALAWLSTLGGAFSALGDNFEHCAIMAGRISVTQFKIAIRLGDPPTVSRCRLFYALSLIQRGSLKMARSIIENEYKKAITVYARDRRLRKMCCGIWAKLQYEWKRKLKSR
ncbi:uncharacterized protein F58A4.6 [Planococcus citri]|uniref:uncharacterized protein F58A4.6 n=1 Tax=Planococcus citri TaxID=170843 RepID=UPI0031F751F4